MRPSGGSPVEQKARGKAQGAAADVRSGIAHPYQPLEEIYGPKSDHGVGETDDHEAQRHRRHSALHFDAAT